MQIKFATLDEAVSTRSQALFANSALSASTVYDAVVVPTTGFHLYGDLLLSDSLSTAETEKTAQTLLEAIEDVADIVSAAAASLDDVWLFEIQGLRTHIFIEAEECNAFSVARLVSVASYLSQSVDERLRKLVTDDYRKFCMAAAHGEAIVVSTGREGDDSLISLGNAANRPAKRLGREDLDDGTLAIPIEIAKLSQLLAEETAAQASNRWVHVDVLHKKLPVLLAEYELRKLSSTINESVEARAAERHLVKFAADSHEFLEMAASSVATPAVTSGLFLRADLDGFTAKIEEASAQGENAIRQVVEEFLQILELPNAFESYLNQPIKRLPWAGDCYNAIILPEQGQTYGDLRKNSAPIACLHWHDPKGAVNATREPNLRKVADAHKWSVGIAGGKNGRMLVANIVTRQRSFTVAAGWAVRYSLEAQVSKGLSASESAAHIDDHAEMSPPYKAKFSSWDGVRGFRKATATSLQDAANEQISGLGPEKIVPSIVVPHIKVASRPYGWDEK